MQVKQTSLGEINGLDEVGALALHHQPSPSRENLQDTSLRIMAPMMIMGVLVAARRSRKARSPSV